MKSKYILLSILHITSCRKSNFSPTSPLLNRNLKLPPSLLQAPPSLIQEIRDHAPYAAIAYCDEFERNLDNRNTDMLSEYAILHRVIEDKETQTHAQIYLNKENGEIVTAFRGSDTIVKFFYSYMATTTTYQNIPKAKVHQPSLEYTESIFYQVSSILATLRTIHPNFRIVLVGHSLGGNIATLMAPMLATDLNIVPISIRVITYGQLRVGNQEFAKHYNSFGFNFTRVVNKADPAADHPPYDDGWAHVHHEVYINNKDKFFLCSIKFLEDPACSHKKSKNLAILTEHEYIADIKISPRGCGAWDFMR